MHGWLIHSKRPSNPQKWWESWLGPEGMTETLLTVHVLALR